jgi:cytochrome b561
MRRPVAVSRPAGWRYWTRRAAHGVLVGFVRGLLVMGLLMVAIMGARWLSAF